MMICRLPIYEILWYLIEILSCNRAMFTRPDFNMMFNIDIKDKSDFKEVAGSINVHGSIFVQTGYPKKASTWSRWFRGENKQNWAV